MSAKVPTRFSLTEIRKRGCKSTQLYRKIWDAAGDLFGNYRRGIYTSMVMTGRLENHFAEVSELASKRVDDIVAEVMKREAAARVLTGLLSECLFKHRGRQQ